MAHRTLARGYSPIEGVARAKDFITGAIALLRAQAWHVRRPLDVAAMRRATRHFVGRHDFRSFRANPDYDTDSTVRNLTCLDLRRSGPLLTFIIEGDRFLYKMCRGLVGTLVQVGEGKIVEDEIPAILAGRDRRIAGMTAPAHGLVLWKVFYRKRVSTRRPPSQ